MKELRDLKKLNHDPNHNLKCNLNSDKQHNLNFDMRYHHSSFT